MSNREPDMSYLYDWEKEILNNLPEGGRCEFQAYIIWEQGGEIEAGPCRYASRGESGATLYSVSPFPGAWVYINESQIKRVRSAESLNSAMSIYN